MEKNWWYSEENKETIVVPSVAAIAVYSNKDGDVVLRQQDPMSDEDSVIIIPKMFVQQVLQAIHSEIQD